MKTTVFREKYCACLTKKRKPWELRLTEFLFCYERVDLQILMAEGPMRLHRLFAMMYIQKTEEEYHENKISDCSRYSPDFSIWRLLFPASSSSFRLRGLMCMKKEQG